MVTIRKRHPSNSCLFVRGHTTLLPIVTSSRTINQLYLYSPPEIVLQVSATDTEYLSC